MAMNLIFASVRMGSGGIRIIDLYYKGKLWVIVLKAG
jgi:hypothetical protein